MQFMQSSPSQFMVENLQPYIGPLTKFREYLVGVSEVNVSLRLSMSIGVIHKGRPQNISQN